jgi:hypothetical protein
MFNMTYSPNPYETAYVLGISIDRMEDSLASHWRFRAGAVSE